MRHRVILTAEADVEGQKVDDLLRDLIQDRSRCRGCEPDLSLRWPRRCRWLLLAKLKRIFPHRPLILLIAAPGLLSLTLMWIARAVRAVVGVRWLDRLRGRGRFVLACRAAKDFAAERHALRIASLKKSHPVQLIVTNRSQPPAAGLGSRRRSRSAQGGARRIAGAARPAAVAPRLRYQLHAGRRGAFMLAISICAVAAGFGLWQRYLDYPAANRNATSIPT